MKRISILLLAILMVIGLLPKTAYAAEVSTFDQDLTAYLSEISTTRGFEVTQADIDESLAAYYMTTEDFTTVAEMKDFLGDAINADLSNLDSIYSTYDLDQAGLTDLLNEYGEEINDYIFVNDLDWAVSFYTNSDTSVDTSGLGIDPSAYLGMVSELGLSDDELTNLQTHFESISDSLNSAEVTAQMEDLNNRMVALQQSILEKVGADSNYQPTDAEISEMTSIYNELFDILQLKVEYSLNENGTLTPITLEELFKLSDIEGKDLSLNIYDSNYNLLADAVVTSDFVKSMVGDLINLTGSTGTTSDDASGDGTVKTVKGGELPKTASNYLSNALLGLIAALGGIIVYRKVRTDKGETFAK